VSLGIFSGSGWYFLDFYVPFSFFKEGGAFCYFV
jgi:hypothetical protein